MQGTGAKQIDKNATKKRKVRSSVLPPTGQQKQQGKQSPFCKNTTAPPPHEPMGVYSLELTGPAFQRTTWADLEPSQAFTVDVAALLQANPFHFCGSI